MARKTLFAIIAVLFFAVQIHAAPRDLASRITGFDVVGNSDVSDKDILAATFSKIGESIEQDKINNDLKAIYYMGYFKDISISFEAYQDGSKIIYSVVENPKIKAVNVSGNTVYSTPEIIGALGLKIGNVFNYKIFREGIDSINKKYKDDGYTLARIVDASADEGIVNIKIVEGFVEGISLEGNEATKDYVILREMNLKRGRVYNEIMLSKDIKRIFNMGFFSEINPLLEPGSTSDKINLVIKVKETKTNTVNFGGGYGEREGWFGFADLAVNNLMGTGQGLLLRGQTGQQLATYQFRYTNPWFMPDKLGPRTSYTIRLWDMLGTDIYVSQQDEKHTGWDMAFGKTKDDIYGATFNFGSEAVAPRGTGSFEAYTSNYFGLSLSYDTRDNWMNPNSGVNHILSFKQGWKYTSRQTAYFKVGLDLNGFKPIAEHQVLANHLGVGIGLGDVPLGELYWTGGPNTVRGYGLNEIKRGTKRILYNLEYRYTFNDTFQGVFFFDLGNAWTPGDPNFMDFMSGWGPGVRMTTPMGPIRLDYGVGAGKTIPEGILHFSIGQAF